MAIYHHKLYACCEKSLHPSSVTYIHKLAQLQLFGPAPVVDNKHCVSCRALMTSDDSDGFIAHDSSCYVSVVEGGTK